MHIDDHNATPPRTPRAGLSSWLTSTVLHAVALLVLGLIVIPVGSGLVDRTVLELNEGAEESEGLFQLDQAEVPEMASESHVLMPVTEPLISLTDGVGQMVSDPRVQEAWFASSQKTDLSLLDTDLVVSPTDADAMFFGTTASGRDFVFILDCSGSMNARSGGRFERAREELLTSVSKLRPEQRFYVYLFNWSTFPMFGSDDPGHLVEANGENVSKLRAWLYGVRPASGTDPRRSMAGALIMRPDAIFLLSDGQFNRPQRTDLVLGWDSSPGTVFDVVENKETPKVQVNTIAFEDPTAAVGMERLANMTEGQYRYIAAPKQVEPPPEDAKLDRKAMAKKFQSIRKAENLVRAGKDAEARGLVENIDPDTMPDTIRERLQNIIRSTTDGDKKP